ncbi:MAG: transcriptional regulator [Piscirickettsiaceae bacterium]|jgi:hypothetical protein|nr:transcriptional regulator [Piscirickettsiaceae bacterium]
MSNQNNKVLVTIITEAVLESDIAEKIEQSNATGYTVFNVRGKGASLERQGDWKENANIQFEVICSAQVAENLATGLKKIYFENYHMIIYQSAVNVMRANKF